MARIIIQRRIAGVLMAGALSLGGLSAGSTYAQSEERAPPPLPMLLQLRPDQRGVWRDYRNELAQERADAEADRHELEQLNAMTTPQRLDWARGQSARREARELRQANATLTFYEALSPQQRRGFDEATRMEIPPPPVRSSGARRGFGFESEPPLTRPPMAAAGSLAAPAD